MSSKIFSPIISSLLILGGAVFIALGGTHAIYMLLDLRYPRRLAPADPALVQAMSNSAVRITRGGTDMWRVWVGVNFTHSLGLLLFGSVAIWVGTRLNTFSAPGVMPALILIGCMYFVLSYRYFFTTPTISLAVGTVCFAAAWLLRLWTGRG